MSGRLAGKVALVTGGASGIGAACVKRFADEGAVVVGLDVSTVPQSEWGERGAARFMPVDVRNEDAIRAAVSSVVQEQEQLDIVVNAAGVEGIGTVIDIDQAEWERVIGVNLTGTFLVCKHVLPVMVAAGAAASSTCRASRGWRRSRASRRTARRRAVSSSSPATSPSTSERRACGSTACAPASCARR